MLAGLVMASSFYSFKIILQKQIGITSGCARPRHIMELFSFIRQNENLLQTTKRGPLFLADRSTQFYAKSTKIGSHLKAWQEGNTQNPFYLSACMQTAAASRLFFNLLLLTDNCVNERQNTKSRQCQCHVLTYVRIPTYLVRRTPHLIVCFGFSIRSTLFPSTSQPNFE